MGYLPRLSHSKVEDYLRCEELYRLKRVEKVPTRPSVWLVGGSAFHTWTEKRDQGQIDDLGLIRVADADDGTARYEEAWKHLFDAELAARQAETEVPVAEWRTAGRKTKDKPHGENMEFWRNELGPQMCERYIDWFDASSDLQILTDLPPDANGNTVGIEYELSFTIEGVEIKAFLDRVGVDSQGRTIVRDYKTGTRVPKTTQLYLYMLGLLKKGVVATHGDYYMSRKGETTEPVDLTSWYESKMGRIYRPIAERIAAGQFVPHPGEACSGCDVFTHCQFGISSYK